MKKVGLEVVSVKDHANGFLLVHTTGTVLIVEGDRPKKGESITVNLNESPDSDGFLKGRILPKPAPPVAASTGDRPRTSDR